jgi:hypothetical protein
MELRCTAINAEAQSAQFYIKPNGLDTLCQSIGHSNTSLLSDLSKANILGAITQRSCVVQLWRTGNVWTWRSCSALEQHSGVCSDFTSYLQIYSSNANGFVANTAVVELLGIPS